MYPREIDRFYASSQLCPSVDTKATEQKIYQ